MWWSSAQGRRSQSSIYDLRRGMSKSMSLEQSLTDADYGIRRICRDEVADKCKPLWGMDEEGEINGCWKDMGVPGLWYIMDMLLLFRRENSCPSFVLPDSLFSGRLVLLPFFPRSPVHSAGETPAPSPFVLPGKS